MGTLAQARCGVIAVSTFREFSFGSHWLSHSASDGESLGTVHRCAIPGLTAALLQWLWEDGDGRIGVDRTFIVAFPHSYPPIPLSFRHSENEIFIQYHAKEHAFITRWRHQSSFSSEPAVIYSCLRSSR